MSATQTKRDNRVELVHIGILLGGLLVIINASFELMSPETPLIYPLLIATVWTVGYYGFVKLLPRSLSGQP